MSYFRQVSIYNDQKKFKNDNEELLFAKTYNEKLYGRGKENEQLQQYLSPDNSKSFKNNDHIQALQENIQNQRNIHKNNPNFVNGNPITHQGKAQQIQKPQIRRNENYDYANVFQSPEQQFKSSQKKIVVPPSQTNDLFQKRQLKTASSYSQNIVGRNPILNEKCQIQQSNKVCETAGGKVSTSYKKMQDIKYILPSDRAQKQNQENNSSFQRVPLVHTGANFKDILQNNEYAVSKNQQCTSKCTEINSKERQIKFGELNYQQDHRKRSNMLQREQIQAQKNKY